MSDEYQWITQEEFLMEVKNLEYLMQDFCSGSDLYKYEDVCTYMQAIRDIIVRVHKRKHYFYLNIDSYLIISLLLLSLTKPTFSNNFIEGVLPHLTSELN